MKRSSVLSFAGASVLVERLRCSARRSSYCHNGGLHRDETAVTAAIWSCAVFVGLYQKGELFGVHRWSVHSILSLDPCTRFVSDLILSRKGEADFIQLQSLSVTGPLLISESYYMQLAT